MAEDYAKALQAVGEAERLEPDNAHYRITRAQILGQLGQLTEALQEAQKAAELAEQQPHLRARAFCLQGDLLASGVQARLSESHRLPHPGHPGDRSAD